ncbi:hypothetical protein GOODEAATRI_028341 [Goodea atripinnis]|uniref:Uncharacterized protein n=1 Tax=Goodea atripinnis TaxID=208336 RepID=A0ABV0MLE9_9TELE
MDMHVVYTLIMIGGRFQLSLYFKIGSEINLMCSIMFEEVSRAMLSFNEPFQADACDVSITSRTQNRSCITSWVELDITLEDMALVHPISMCTLNKELFLFV